MKNEKTSIRNKSKRRGKRCLIVAAIAALALALGVAAYYFVIRPQGKDVVLPQGTDVVLPQGTDVVLPQGKEVEICTAISDSSGEYCTNREVVRIVAEPEDRRDCPVGTEAVYDIIGGIVGRRFVGCARTL